jgi:hypothetical protein
LASVLVWKGELAAAPASPERNWAYYHTADKKSYLYDGSAWQVFARDGGQGEPGSAINEIHAAIAEALANKTGSDPGPYTVTVSGVDLTDDYAVRNLYHGIAAGIPGGAKINLDLSGCVGWGVFRVSGLPAADKDRYSAITLPDTVTAIGSGGVFSGFSSLAAFTAPSVTEVGDSAFSECAALTTLSLPSAEDIGYYAFENCAALTTLTLGAAPPAIRSGIFYGTATGSGAGGTITILVPDPSAYTGGTPAWPTGTDTGFYGGGSKAVAFTAL